MHFARTFVSTKLAGAFSTLSFIVGAITSVLSGYLGM